MSAALGAHDGDGGLCDPEKVEEVGFELLSGLFFGGFFDGYEEAVTCIVDDDVEAS